MSNWARFMLSSSNFLQPSESINTTLFYSVVFIKSIPLRRQFEPCYTTNMKKYWITGVSGTGKTTVGVALANKGFYVIDVEEVEGVCGWYSRETNHFVDFPKTVTAEFSDAHQWRLDLEKLDQLLDTTNKSVILVGMNDVLKETMSTFEKVFILRCDPDVFIGRLNTRDNNQFGKEDSIQQNILGFYKRYEAKMMDVGAISIDSNQNVEDVVEQIASHLV